MPRPPTRNRRTSFLILIMIRPRALGEAAPPAVAVWPGWRRRRRSRLAALAAGPAFAYAHHRAEARPPPDSASVRSATGHDFDG